MWEKRGLSVARLIRRARKHSVVDSMLHLSNHFQVGDSSLSCTKYSKCDTDESAKAGRNAYVRSKASSRTIHQQAVNKLQQLSTRYQSRQQLQLRDGITLPPYVVHPHDIIAQSWWAFILLTVVVTCWWEPWGLAFTEYPGLYPPTSFDTVMSIVLMALYAGDIALSFFVAYYQDGQLVVDLKDIAVHYAKSRLWVDLATTFPFDWLALGVLGLQASSSTRARYISMLRLLRLGRVYRMHSWLVYLRYHQAVSLLLMTVIRNIVVVFFLVHWAACGFYFIARQWGFTTATWVGANMEEMEHARTWDRYAYSLYWAIITFATVGYGDIHAYNVAEAVFIFIYVFISIIMTAWIVGTITLLVVKSDEKTGEYRDSLSNLEVYTVTHDIPQELAASMRDHLRLQFSSQESSDDQVLRGFPTAIQRRVLRHLYLTSLTSCWMFRGCTKKFLDGLLAAAKVELFMPQVEMCTEGDHINELHLLVAGGAVMESSQLSSNSESVMLDIGDSVSTTVGSTRRLGPGDCFGEVAFFTEIPMMQTVHTTTVCRVLVISRADYHHLVASFPTNAKYIMDNLLAMADELILDEFPGPIGDNIMAHKEAWTAMSLQWRTSPSDPTGDASGDTSDTRLLSQQQQRQQSISSSSSQLHNRHQSAFEISGGGVTVARPPLSRAGAASKKQYQDHGKAAASMSTGSSTSSAAARAAAGAPAGLRPYYGYGSIPPPPPAAAAAAAAVAASDPSRTYTPLDLSQGLSLLQRRVLGLLLHMRALLGQQRERLQQERTNEFLTAAAAGDAIKTQLMLQEGMDVNACDYDQRTALMVAAGRGHSSMVRQLILAGADPNLKDELGSCALLEAAKGGHEGTIRVLLEGGGLMVLHPVLAAAHLCTAVFDGDLLLLKRLLLAGVEVDAQDYDRRTALHIAAADGNLGAVRTLIEEGHANPSCQDRWGHTPVEEAQRAGAQPVVQYLKLKMGLGAGSTMASSLGGVASAAADVTAADRGLGPGA